MPYGCIFLLERTAFDRPAGVVVERQPLVREVVGSIPGRVLFNTFKMVVMAALLDDLDCCVSR